MVTFITSDKSGITSFSIRKTLIFVTIFGFLPIVLFNFYFAVDKSKRSTLLIPNQMLSVVVSAKRLQNTTEDMKRLYPENKIAGKSKRWYYTVKQAKESSEKVMQDKAFAYKSKMINKDQLNMNKKWTKFRFHLDTDMIDLVRRYKRGGGVTEKTVFSYLYDIRYDETDKCSSDGILFLFLIKSAVGNFERRNAIRKTWAMDSELQRHSAMRKFLVGMGKNSKNLVREENDLNKDIIEMSFHDNYYNNTLKTIGGIHWVAKHCNKSKFVVMVDDDMFVATPRVSQYLKVNISANTSFYGGFVATHYPPREKNDKWYVSREDYPYDVYPDMPSGGFTIMSMPFVIDVHIASQYTKKFIYDDCYMGILAYRLHIQPVDIPAVRMAFVRPTDGVFNNLLAAHSYSVERLLEAWTIMKKQEQTEKSEILQ